MAKMKTEMAAAKPYWAPWAPNASRNVYVISRSVAPVFGLSAGNGPPSVMS